MRTRLTLPSCQAFIEMNTEEAANTMVNYYTSVTPVLRGQPIYIQFSNHKELKTDSSPNQAVRVWAWGLGRGGWSLVRKEQVAWHSWP